MSPLLLLLLLLLCSFARPWRNQHSQHGTC
jgi:hypothetical protein